MQFSFWKPHFWHPQNFAKTLFWHNVTLFVFSKIPQKHYKNGRGGKQWKKNLDQFLTLNLDQFLTLKPPNLEPAFNFTAEKYGWLDINSPREVTLMLALKGFGGGPLKIDIYSPKSAIAYRYIFKSRSLLQVSQEDHVTCAKLWAFFSHWPCD